MITKNIFIRVVQQVLQLVITLAIARFTGPRGNGVFSLFITDVSFFILLLGFGVDSSFLYFSAKKKISLSQMISLLLPLLVLQAILFFVAYFLCHGILGYRFFKVDVDTPGVGWGFIYVFGTIAYNYFTAFLASKKIFFKIALLNIIMQLLFLLTVLYKYVQPAGTTASFFSIENLIPVYTAMYVLNALAAMLLVFRYADEKIALKNPLSILNKDMLRYSLTVYTGNVFQFFAYRMDIWFMDHYQSKQSVGIYALASKIAQLWWLLPQLIALLLFPLTVLEHSSVNKDKFKQMIMYNIALNLFGAIAAIFIFPVFIHTIVGDAFLPSYIPFLYLLPGVLLFSVNILLAARLSGKGNTIINMSGSILCFVTILILDICLIPGHGAVGAAIASSIGYGTSTLFVIFKYRKWASS